MSDDYHTEDTIALCPGFVLTLGEENPQRAFERLSLILGHELGHAVDSSKFPELYSSRTACVLKKFPANQDTDMPRLVRELGGDYWGGRVGANLLRGGKNSDDSWQAGLASLFSSSGDDLQRSDYTMLTRALTGMCLIRGPDVPADLIMAAGYLPTDDRITMMLALPKIRSAFGCGEASYCPINEPIKLPPLDREALLKGMKGLPKPQNN